MSVVRQPQSVSSTAAPLTRLDPAKWLAVVVGVVTTATFLLALGNGFVNFDDGGNFVRNPHYRGLGFEHLRWMFTTTHMGQYIPLTWMTLGLDYVIWGMNPFGYHLTSLLLHAAMAVAFYFLALRLLGIVTGRATDWTTACGAAAAALIFAVHPLRVESVAWATERRDVLSGLFYVLCLLAWLRAIESRQVNRRWYWTAVALFACAVFSKALTVTLVAVLLLLDIYPLRRLGRETGWWGPGARAVVAEKLPFAVLALGGSVLAFLAQAAGGDVAPLDRVGLPERLAVWSLGLMFYLWKTFVPVGLSPLYEFPARVVVNEYVLCFVGVVAVSVAAFVERRRAPWLAVTWSAYVLTLLPVTGLFQNGPQIAADRYSYLPSLGLTLILGGGVAAALTRLARRGREPQLAALIGVVFVVVTLQVLTVEQVGVWRDGVTLWTHAARVDPSSAIAYNNLGDALLEAGHLDEAAEAITRAADHLPAWLPRKRAHTTFMLGTLLHRRGELEGAEHRYRQALALDPYHPDAWNGLGAVLAERGKFEPALEAFTTSIAVNPDKLEACENAYRAAGYLNRTAPFLIGCPRQKG